MLLNAARSLGHSRQSLQRHRAGRSPVQLSRPLAPTFSPSASLLSVKLCPRRQQRSVRLSASSASASASTSPASIPPPGAVKQAFDEFCTTAALQLATWEPPRFLWRAAATFLMAGQVVKRVFAGKVHWANTQDQLRLIGPATLGVTMLTASFVGMVFTIQFVREFARLGLTRSVGGVLSLAFSRELTPVISAIIMAGRVGSAIAAELGTMAVSEQTDTLRVLRSDPLDYLVTPRVLACCVSLPLLSCVAFTVGLAASSFLADVVYGVAPNVIIESAKRALVPWDICAMLLKSGVFAFSISIISCGWGSTTLGGAKGVGESTTAAVVISLVSIFVLDFLLSLAFFSGTGDALHRLS